ncbi:putative RNA polymerase II subunit B1 CTD phosphatase RPAP2 [Maniola jurtina]|uniref:putative RNA polymerase II subunit B1 CTD phosphatase RPAP2 n=1 Tax=Maniola jurtina TaxID=191418 RepID=UPI001E687269|nr:putative RNA polymerase II subunit B1 CTD phosphatase RPAP2 [Maniola jurtina]
MEAQAKRPIKRPTKIEEMTKEQIRQAIVKKQECNAKAQHIVESLLEKNIQEDYFLKCLCDINQSHFEDVIEERSILHLCGYPICQKTLCQKDIPKQKYRISMKTNKVYDITARKSFCSNICYKSAVHVKKQMLTSPLWFREYEKIPQFSLLPLDSVGSMGQEVDLSLTERIVLKAEGQTFTSINDFTNATLNEMDKHQNKTGNNGNSETNNLYSKTDNIIGVSKETNSHLQTEGTNRNNQSTNITTTENTTVKKDVKNTSNNLLDLAGESTIIQIPKDITTVKEESVSQKKTLNNPLNIIGDVIEKPGKQIDPILVNNPNSAMQVKNATNNKRGLQKKQPSITAITIEVEKCLAEWFTIDTLLFLFGEEKVKEMVADKGDCIQEYLNNYSKHIAYSSNTYDQYQALCRKLNMLELEDRRFDSQTLARETKPLPDYNLLKEESKKLQLKVKAFFSGETEIPIQNENAEVEPDKTNDEEYNFNKTQLPLIDKNAQNALRRRIVCKHLNTVLPDLLKSLGLLTLTISTDIRLLVNTFKLKANNIMFKPIQWTLIAIVFIKLLSLRDGRLEFLLDQPMAYQHMQLLLLSYKQDGGYLDRLISWLTDIDRLLDVNDTQLTIEIAT